MYIVWGIILVMYKNCKVGFGCIFLFVVYGKYKNVGINIFL